jgi:hypothetical protein
MLILFIIGVVYSTVIFYLSTCKIKELEDRIDLLQVNRLEESDVYSLKGDAMNAHDNGTGGK